MYNCGIVELQNKFEKIKGEEGEIYWFLIVNKQKKHLTLK